MKKLIFFASTILFAVACNNNGGKSETGVSDSTKPADTKMADVKAEKPDYPYTLEKPYQNWQPGDQQHVVTVMKFLKALETKNLTECASYFGDTADIRLDYYHKKLPHDSIPALLDFSWSDVASVSISMGDWESVISSDKKEEWVTLWYKQKWVDKKGKTDSLSVINDAKIVNGKIVVFDEKIQHYPVAKK
jgi:hypothetical protein